MVLGLALTGCSGDDPGSDGAPGSAASGVATDVSVDTLVTTASGLVGEPTDLELGADGTLYILDGLNAQLHRIGPDGGHLGSFGGEGAGPTELSRPRAVARGRGDTLFVVDGGNGRLQVYLADGAHAESRPLPPRAANLPSHVGRDGTLVYATVGLDSARAGIADREGNPVLSLGTPASIPETGIVSMSALREEIADGGVPELFRNTSWPLVTASGEVWLSTPAEAVLVRYGPDGAALDSVVVDDPTFPGIEEHFRARNADPEYQGLYPLRYVQDQVEAGGEIFLFLNPAGDGPAVIHRYGGDGVFVSRHVVEEVRGAGLLEVDGDRGRLYLAILDTAEILALGLPELFR